MTQQKGEKIHQFAGRLETKFKKLKERIPGRYDEKILKERLFHGMHQNLRDSIQFCYKQEGTMYAKLFSETLDAEKEKGPESKATTVKIKSATLDQVQGEDSGIQDLKRKLDNLTTVVKSANYGGARPKQVNNTNNLGNDSRSGKKGPANNEGSQPRPRPNKPSLPFKGKGPATTSAGPFKEGSRPYQCYTCGGWVIAGANVRPRGPGLEGFKRIQTSSKVSGKGSRGSEETINGGTLGIQGEGEERYYNPNPRVRLIGPRNEIRTEVNGGLEMTLIDSGAQISAISEALCIKLDLPVWQLSDEVNFVGFGGVTLQNKGYTRIRLRIPGIKEFDKDVLLFVQPDSDYTKKRPSTVGY